MNIKIEVFKNGTSIFKGKLLTLPFKEDEIVQKSIELFGDDEPCVIHQSYVIRGFASEIADALENEISYESHPHLIEKLNFEDLETIVIQRRA